MVHDAAARGFERHAAIYARSRPSYHPAVIAHLVDRYGRTGTVVELGAGTGILTAELVAAGVAVVAVEPVAAMRAELRASVPGAEVVDGTAEAAPVAGGSADAVVAAQAFHWFDPARALDEIHRVLRPGGALITVWNVTDDSAAWVAALGRVVEPYAGDAPRRETMAWRRAIDADPRFEPVDDLAVPNPRRATPDGVVDRVLSTSFIAALPGDEQALVEADVRAVVAGLGDDFDHPHTTELQAWAVSSG